VQEFLDNHRGPGVQHIALHTSDIFDTVGKFANRGVKFITVPACYYQDLFHRHHSFIPDKRDALERMGILADVRYAKDDLLFQRPKYILQTFSHSVNADRPALFLEIISRMGSDGFGKRTIKALFEAVEKVQQQRLAANGRN